MSKPHLWLRAETKPLEQRCALSPSNAEAMIAQGLMLDVDATLETAMPLFSKSDTGFIPVVAVDSADLLGVLYEVDALRAFNQALVETAREEHS